MTLRRSVGGLAVAGLLTLLPLAAGTMPAHASIGLLVAPARIDLAERPSDSTITRQLSVANRGSGRDTFSISAVDVVVHDGIPESLPPSSTPYSLSTITSIRPSTLTLDPGKEGTVKVAFDVSAHKPVLGALLVVPQQQAAADTAPSGNGSVGMITLPRALVIVSAAPVEASGELLPSISLGVAPVTLNAPTLVESGPITATATLRNSGNTYERVFSTYEFSNLGHVWLRVQAPPSSAMPRGSATTAATTRQRLEASGQSVDTAPWLCLCEVKVSTYAWLANRATTPPVVQTATVIIFPWRIAGIMLVAFAISILYRRWFWRRGWHGLYRRP